MEKKLHQAPTDCLRIVLYGPESTGKSTLAKALAEYYNTQWVPEFARDFLQEKWDREKAVCTLDDLLTIARGQLELENDLISTSQRFIFCDTNILVTKAWSETHFDGYCAPELQHWVEKFHYDHYFLTNVDVPWEADDLRDRPDQRRVQFDHFKGLLDQLRVSYTLLKGKHPQRMKQAISILESLQTNKS